MILIYPPVAKISEPPPGVAILAGALKQHNIDCKVVDANLEGMLWLGKSSVTGIRTKEEYTTKILKDRWSMRAITHLDRNISDLKNIKLYKNMARYRQRVMDLNRAINIASDRRFTITLSDYTDSNLTPVKSEDMLTSACKYRENPFYPFFEAYLKDEIKKHLFKNRLNFLKGKHNSYDYIGISLCYMSQAHTSFALAGWIKARFPETKIVMGGGLVTSWMSMPTWSDPFKSLVHLMVRGRGEEALVNLFVKRCEKIKTTLCDGIALNKPNTKNAIKYPNHTYRPDFDLCKWDQYVAPGRILPFRTSTGCYWNRCRFCPEKAEGNSYRPGKSNELLDDLNYLTNRYQPEYVHFIDDAIPPSFLKALISHNSLSNYYNLHGDNFDSNNHNAGIKYMKSQEPPYKWYGFVRFTQELSDQEFCHALYRSGCRMLKLGLESGDQSVINKMDKGTDLSLASNVLTCLKNAGIGTYVYLLFGTQFEDEAGANKTLDYVISHNDRISFLNLAIFNMPRCSEDAANLETDLFSQGDLSLYLNFKHPKGWDRKKVRFFLERKFKKEPAIAEILKHDPPFFTSNHAMFII